MATPRKRVRTADDIPLLEAVIRDYEASLTAYHLIPGPNDAESLGIPMGPLKPGEFSIIQKKRDLMIRLRAVNKEKRQIEDAIFTIDEFMEDNGRSLVERRRELDALRAQKNQQKATAAMEERMNKPPPPPQPSPPRMSTTELLGALATASTTTATVSSSSSPSPAAAATAPTTNGTTATSNWLSPYTPPRPPPPTLRPPLTFAAINDKQ